MAIQEVPANLAKDGPTHANGGVEFRLSRKKPATILFWMACVFMLMVVYFWITGQFRHTSVIWVLMIMLTGMYGITRYREVRADRDRSIKLRISPRGIEIPDAFAGVMSWNDIGKLRFSKYKDQTTLHVEPRDPGKYKFAPRPALLSWLPRKGGSVLINRIEGEKDDVVGALRRFGPDWLTASF